MSHRILIVEDEKEIADTIVYALQSERFAPDWAADCASATVKLSESPYALAVFDVGLPDGSGFELLKSLRTADHANSAIPVIFLTARDGEIDRIVGLEIGADDYVCKPFSPRELSARVKAVLRRTQESVDQQSPTQERTAPFSHHYTKKIISLNEQALDLTRAEYQLLLTLLGRPGQVFSRRQLIDHVWSENHPSDDRAIDTHIKTLRAKLRPHNPHREFIVTHRGFGYSLEL